MNQHINKRLKL